jgi:recombinational DNA repair ATPase RecF
MWISTIQDKIANLDNGYKEALQNYKGIFTEFNKVINKRNSVKTDLNSSTTGLSVYGNSLETLNTLLLTFFQRNIEYENNGSIQTDQQIFTANDF